MEQRYEKAKLYKIYSPSNNDLDPFYGATCEKYLSTRLSKHKLHYKQYLEKKHNRRSPLYDILDEADAKIELVKFIPVRSKDEMTAKLNEFIEDIPCANKLKCSSYKKKIDYYQCECGAQVLINGRKRHMQTRKHQKYEIDNM